MGHLLAMLSMLFWQSTSYTIVSKPGQSGDRAHTLSSYGQLVTSSCLGWVGISSVKSGMVTSNLAGMVKDRAICRIKDGDDLIPGRTDIGENCLGEGIQKIDYQVLVDLVGMARLEWRHWDMFTRPQIGSVAYNENIFIGRFQKDGVPVIGDLDFGRGMNGDIRAFLRNNKEVKRTIGEVLVEVEPIKYQLENIIFHRGRGVKTKTQIHLGSVTLHADTEHSHDWVMARTTVHYLHPSYSYWGYVPGTVRGLPVRVQGNATTFTQAVWGVEQREELRGEYMVQARLQSGTAKNLTLTGILVRREVPYTATLTMVYMDGIVRRHTVHATHVSDSMEEFLENSGQPYFSKSGISAPTTTITTSSTSTTQSSTSITTTSTTSKTSSSTSYFSPVSFLLPSKPTKHVQASNPPNPLRLFYPTYDDSDSDRDGYSDSVLICSTYSDSVSLSLSSVALCVSLCHMCGYSSL